MKYTDDDYRHNCETGDREIELRILQTIANNLDDIARELKKANAFAEAKAKESKATIHKSDNSVAETLNQLKEIIERRGYSLG